MFKKSFTGNENYNILSVTNNLDIYEDTDPVYSLFVFWPSHLEHFVSTVPNSASLLQ